MDYWRGAAQREQMLVSGVLLVGGSRGAVIGRAHGSLSKARAEHSITARNRIHSTCANAMRTIELPSVQRAVFGHLTAPALLLRLHIIDV